MSAATKSPLNIPRYFTNKGVNPFDTIEWEKRTAQITGSDGNIIFEQKDVETPKAWSATATNIVASKYLHGKIGAPERESGIRSLIDRVVTTITNAAVNQGYLNTEGGVTFAAELRFILITQRASFNSPVWFNVGCHLLEPAAMAGSWHWDEADQEMVYSNTGYHHPQCSACFINAVDDSMEGIMNLARTEALLFKFGSGCTSGKSNVFIDQAGVIPLADAWKRYTEGRSVIDFDGKGSYVDVRDLGLQTLGMDKSTGSQALYPVQYLWRYQVNQDEKLKISFDTGARTEVSAWHPFEVWDGSSIISRRADELVKGDLVIGTCPQTADLLPVKPVQVDYSTTHYGKAKDYSIKIDNDLAWLIGYFAGDGSLGKHTKVTTNKQGKKYQYTSLRLRFFDETVSCLEHVQRIMLDKFGAKAGIQKDGRGSNGKHLVYSSRQAAAFFASLFRVGPKGQALRLPDFIWQLGKAAFFHLLAGLLDSDGACSEGRGVYTTESLQLAEQVSALANLVGLGGGLVQQESVWSVTIIHRSRETSRAALASAMFHPIRSLDLMTHIPKARYGSMSISLDLAQSVFGLEPESDDRLHVIQDGSPIHIGRLRYQGIINPLKAVRMLENVEVLSNQAQIIRNVAESAAFVTGTEPCQDNPDFYDMTVGVVNNYLAGQHGMVVIHNTGTNFSSLRSSAENVSGGGVASGPLSFMKGLDAFAGVIKSGGKCLGFAQPVYTATGPIQAQTLARMGKEFVILSYSKRLGRMAAKKAQAWFSGEKPMVRVTTDKGQFEVSEDHPFMLKTGEIVRADQMKPGLRLFAAHTSRLGNYVNVGLLDNQGGKELLHRLVAKDILGATIEGISVHHKDSNPLNNDPANLITEWNQAEHARQHSQELVTAGKHVFQNQKFSKAGTDNGMRRNNSFWKSDKAEGYRAAKSAEMLERDPVQLQKESVRQKMLNTGYKLINAGNDITDFDAYCTARKQVLGKFASRTELQRKFQAQFGGYEKFYQELATHNHIVLSVEPLGVQPVVSVEVFDPEEDDKRIWSEHNYMIAPMGVNDSCTTMCASLNTRRAAKMAILNITHPDIEGFIKCKQKEEAKAYALMREGYDGTSGPDSEAYASIFYQNANNSVRVTDEFMAAVEADALWDLVGVTNNQVCATISARKLMSLIAEAAWACGDPGMQYDTTINKWHTSKNTDRINASNPCCLVGHTLADTSEGMISIAELEKAYAEQKTLPLAFSWDFDQNLPALRPISRVWKAGETKRLARVHTQLGHVFEVTPEHRFYLRDGSAVEAQNLQPDQRLRKIARSENKDRSGRRSILHRVTADVPNGCEYQSRWMWEQAFGSIPQGYEVHHINEDPTDDTISNFQLLPSTDHRVQHSQGLANVRYIETEDALLVETWEAVEALPKRTHKNNGLVTPARWNDYIRKNGLSGKVPLARGDGQIQGKSWEEFSDRIQAELSAGNDRIEYVEMIELESPVAVYDMEIPGTHNFAIGRRDLGHSIVVSNSEYMFLDDSACNLASLNLMKFLRKNGTFEIEAYRHTVDIMIIAMDVIIDMAGYPTEQIARNSHDYRPLGLGYANLGALLMALGLSYDSDAGRGVAAGITSLMCGEAYLQSARMSRDLKALKPVTSFIKSKQNAGWISSAGFCPGWLANEEPFKEVVRMHQAASLNIQDCPEDLKKAADKAWDEAVTLGTFSGFRNAQVTVLAPTGTIGFMMDCDTTGVEPELGLVKYKRLVGGGMLKIVNETVSRALSRLGYKEPLISTIIDYIDQTGTVEGSGLAPAHLPVFDCSFKPVNGSRSIGYMGHLKMMAATQPFLSGAISKTINMPEEATVEDVQEAFMLGHELGLKAIAIYRDGSKKNQVLVTRKDEPTQHEESNQEQDLSAPPKAIRHKLPDERQAIIHKFAIAGHEGYIHVGLYPNGVPGEIFVTTAKEGSTISGLLDSFAIMTSLALQHGVHLRTIVDKLAHTRFEPSGFTTNSDIKYAKSIMDYIARYLEARFLKGEQQMLFPADPVPVVAPAPDPDEPPSMSSMIVMGDSPSCSICGSIMVRNGSCYKCSNCGGTSGCS